MEALALIPFDVLIIVLFAVFMGVYDFIALFCNNNFSFTVSHFGYYFKRNILNKLKAGARS